MAQCNIAWCFDGCFMHLLNFSSLVARVDEPSVAFLLLICSAGQCWALQHPEPSIYLENITRILDRLLEGYDNRLRPGFGGTTHFNIMFSARLLNCKHMPVKW